MKKEKFLIWVFFAIVSLIFFYPVLAAKVPFPGDLLVGNYAPYNSYPFLGYGPGGFPHKAQDFDVLKLLYPAKEFAIEMLKAGQFPLWNPYNFSGNPHLASLQSGSFYPANLLFLILPFITAWSVYIFSQSVLAGVFTFLLLREFRLSVKSALFGGLVFAFSSYSAVWIEYGNIGHSILWLPLSMWLSLKLLQKPSAATSLFLILVLTFSLLSGYIQTTVYLFIFLFAFIVFEILSGDRKEALRKFLRFIPIFILPVLLSSVQLFPTIELLSHSARGAYSTAKFIKLLIPPFHLITAFVPDFFGNPATRNYWLDGTYIERVSYIGTIPLFFVIYILLNKRNALVWFFGGALVIVAILAFDSYFSRLVYSLNIPLVSTAVPTRIMFLFCFSASILTSFGFENFEKSKEKKFFFKTGLVLACLYLFLWIAVFAAPLLSPNAVWIKNLAIAKRNLILPSAIFFTAIVAILLSFKLRYLRRYIFIILLGLTIFDLFYFFQKITPFSPKEAIYPQTEVLNYLRSIQGISRSWGYGSGYIEANLQTHEKIFSTDGYDALHLKRYGELISTSKEGKIASPLARSEGDLASGYGPDDLKANIYRQKILNLLGVKYILHKIVPNDRQRTPDYQTFPNDRYDLVYQKGPWQIYENKEVNPRIFLAPSYIVETDAGKIVGKIFDDKFDARETLILEENLPPEIKLQKDSSASISLLSYAPNKVAVATRSESDLLLFISDNYFPGWKVNVDGKGEKIYRADYTFRAVPVSKGNHEVIFWYYPDSFDLGLKVSLVTLSGLLFVIALKFLREKLNL